MNNRKRYSLAGLIAAGILFSIMLMPARNVLAATLKHTRAEAVEWCYQRIKDGNKNVYTEGNYGVQCVGLIKYYTNYLGYKIPPCLNDNAGNYATQSFPSEFKKFYTRYPDKESGKVDPKPGDIFVWAANKYGASSWGHVGVIYEVGSNYYKYIDYQSGGRGATVNCKKDGLRNYSAIIRPNFKNACTHSYQITVSKAPTASANGTWTWKCTKCGNSYTRTIPAVKTSSLREGNYRISSKLNANKYISVTPNQSVDKGNISLYSKDVADQVFTLKKQSNGTYLIKYSSFMLDLDNGKIAGNVQLCTPNGMRPQNWFIVPAGNGYYRITSEKTYYNMDVANAKTENGTNIGTWYNNGNDAQLFKFEFVQCTNHKWDSGTITKQPTTAAEGEKTYTCSVCGEKKTEKIPKIHVHDYKLVSRKKATCTEDAVMVFKCSCGKSYTGTGDWEQYSDWSTKKPSGGANITVESRTQYRYADRGMDWQKTGSGTIDFAAGDWKGFDKNNALYAKYNKTPRLATETPTEKVTVSISKLGYLYFHWCMGAKLEKTYNRTIESYKSGTHKTFHAFYSTADIALTTSANARKSDRYDVCKDTFWWLNERIPISRCSYTVYKKAAVGDWSSWSAWQDTEVKASDTRKVETRTLYRTLTVTPGKATGHNFGPWVKKGNKYQRVCRNDPSHIETKNAVQTNLASVEKDKKVKKAEKVEKVEADILANTKEEAPEESSSFQLLQLRYKKASRKQIKLKWTSVEGAVQYRLYGAPCGKKYKKIGEFTRTSYKAKKLKKNKYYKFYVIAVSAESKVIAQSKTTHVATAGGKKGNFKAVKLKNVKKTLTLKIGRKFKIKASAVRQKGKKVSVHRKLAYESSDPEVASVSKKGKVKAKKPGSAVIYVYSQSGTFAKFTVKAVK